MNKIRDVQVGQIVKFVFTSAGRGALRHRNYADGEIIKVGKRLSIKVLDNPREHEYWRSAHVGKVKVVSVDAIIPDLAE